MLYLYKFLVLRIKPKLDYVVHGDVCCVQLQVDGLGHVEYIPRPVDLMLLLVVVPVPPAALSGRPVGLGVDKLLRGEVGELPELLVVRMDVPDHRVRNHSNIITLLGLINILYVYWLYVVQCS